MPWKLRPSDGFRLPRVLLPTASRVRERLGGRRIFLMRVAAFLFGGVPYAGTRRSIRERAVAFLALLLLSSAFLSLAPSLRVGRWTHIKREVF